MVGIPIPVNTSCDWKITVIVSPTFAYHVFVLLFELNAVVPVMRYGVSLSICICTEVFAVSILFNLSTE
jgi:hypothetical protein